MPRTNLDVVSDTEVTFTTPPQARRHLDGHPVQTDASGNHPTLGRRLRFLRFAVPD